MALDTTNILGRGAVKDTCNLLADGIVQLLRTLAAVEKSSVKEWGKARGYEGYLGSSVKGEAAIDWSDKRARQSLLAEIVRDADRLLELSRQRRGSCPRTVRSAGGLCRGGVAGAVAAPGRGTS